MMRILVYKENLCNTLIKTHGTHWLGFHINYRSLWEIWIEWDSSKDSPMLANSSNKFWTKINTLPVVSNNPTRSLLPGLIQHNFCNGNVQSWLFNDNLSVQSSRKRLVKCHSYYTHGRFHIDYTQWYVTYSISTTITCDKKTLELEGRLSRCE